MDLQTYVMQHTERGECKCGLCIDRGDKPDPTGHTVDMVFFKVAAINNPSADEFRRLTDDQHGVFCMCDPLDGSEHNYMEIGGWIGDQGLAMQYMALGHILGVFQLLTPRSILGNSIDDAMVQQMAGAGLIAVNASPISAATTT